MRNINKLFSEWKSNNHKHRNSNRKQIMPSKGRLDTLSYQMWGKMEEVKMRLAKLLEQVFPSVLPKKALKLQPVGKRKIRKSNVLFSLAVIMLTIVFTNCSNTVPKSEKTPPSDTLALQEQALDKARSNEDYLVIIGDYRMNKAKNLSAYNQESFMFQPVILQVIQTDHQQILDTLKHQHSVLKMRIDSFQENGAESWEAFKMELNQDLNAMKNTLNDSTAISKSVTY